MIKHCRIFFSTFYISSYNIMITPKKWEFIQWIGKDFEKKHTENKKFCNELEKILKRNILKINIIKIDIYALLFFLLLKNYIGSDFATCPFNARHEMPKPELRYHLSNCPDRAVIEPMLAYGRNTHFFSVLFRNDELMDMLQYMLIGS